MVVVVAAEVHILIFHMYTHVHIHTHTHECLCVCECSCDGRLRQTNNPKPAISCSFVYFLGAQQVMFRFMACSVFNASSGSGLCGWVLVVDTRDSFG